eukprot:TRINITY_DN254_c0_g1_i2.p1 TRINITY_DN254_c0_g1~~TRINITY_DN254_c0_g1_i2.p1  ORF type:complete len:1105 (-),score=309.75 TRINITY_DN254_c0_g1_i2:234-3548(-)
MKEAQQAAVQAQLALSQQQQQQQLSIQQQVAAATASALAAVVIPKPAPTVTTSGIPKPTRTDQPLLPRASGPTITTTDVVEILPPDSTVQLPQSKRILRQSAQRTSAWASAPSSTAAATAPSVTSTPAARVHSVEKIPQVKPPTPAPELVKETYDVVEMPVESVVQPFVKPEELAPEAPVVRHSFATPPTVPQPAPADMEMQSLDEVEEFTAPPPPAPVSAEPVTFTQPVAVAQPAIIAEVPQQVVSIAPPAPVSRAAADETIVEDFDVEETPIPPRKPSAWSMPTVEEQPQPVQQQDPEPAPQVEAVHSFDAKQSVTTAGGWATPDTSVTETPRPMSQRGQHAIASPFNFVTSVFPHAPEVMEKARESVKAEVSHMGGIVGKEGLSDREFNQKMTALAQQQRPEEQATRAQLSEQVEAIVQQFIHGSSPIQTLPPVSTSMASLVVPMSTLVSSTPSAPPAPSTAIAARSSLTTPAKSATPQPQPTVAPATPATPAVVQQMTTPAVVQRAQAETVVAFQATPATPVAQPATSGPVFKKPMRDRDVVIAAVAAQPVKQKTPDSSPEGSPVLTFSQQRAPSPKQLSSEETSPVQIKPVAQQPPQSQPAPQPVVVAAKQLSPPRQTIPSIDEVSPPPSPPRRQPSVNAFGTPVAASAALPTATYSSTFASSAVSTASSVVGATLVQSFVISSGATTPATSVEVSRDNSMEAPSLTQPASLTNIPSQMSLASSKAAPIGMTSTAITTRVASRLERSNDWDDEESTDLGDRTETSLDSSGRDFSFVSHQVPMGGFSIARTSSARAVGAPGATTLPSHSTRPLPIPPAKSPAATQQQPAATTSYTSTTTTTTAPSRALAVATRSAADSDFDDSDTEETLPLASAASAPSTTVAAGPTARSQLVVSTPTVAPATPAIPIALAEVPPEDDSPDEDEDSLELAGGTAGGAMRSVTFARPMLQKPASNTSTTARVVRIGSGSNLPTVVPESKPIVFKPTKDDSDDERPPARLQPPRSVVRSIADSFDDTDTSMRTSTNMSTVVTPAKPAAVKPPVVNLQDSLSDLVEELSPQSDVAPRREFTVTRTLSGTGATAGLPTLKTYDEIDDSLDVFDL